MEVPSIFLNKLLREAAKKGARSIYLTVGSPPVLRVKDSLIDFSEDILDKQRIEQVIQSFLSDDEKERLKKEKELIVVKSFLDDYRFRINIFYSKGSPSVSFHYISNQIKDLKSLGLPGAFYNIINYKSGLLILSGPNNSGKTSTAASVVEEVNKKDKRYIVTLEKPIESLFSNKKSIINQREVGSDLNSFKEGLLNCLEEDVDLVYIGEMRDEFDEALPYILELAAGNCFVILEMDTEDSVRTAEKMIGALSKTRLKEAASHFIADVLLGILSQKLIPNKENEYALAYEFLLVNTAVESLIRDNKIYQIDNIIQNYMDTGMISMERSVRNLYNDGIISDKEIGRLNMDLEV